MKRSILITILLLSVYSVYAQDTSRKAVSVTSTVIKKGSELQKMPMSVKITDPKIYDKAGNVVDSLEAIAKVKSFLYTLGWAANKDGEYKRTLFKIDPELQVMIDANTKKLLQPKNTKLREGLVLDLRPLSKKLAHKEMDGKAVLLIFWCDGCFNGSTPDAYKEINEVLTKYKNPDKLEIIAITHHLPEHAMKALMKNPIVNNRHIVDAGEINDSYETENQPLLILTDQTHKILYAIKGNAAITPRILNNTLKEI
ncbi:MAG: hypothetical protein EOO85_19150, partial [Pedobacter sp.]